jgi:hypothetical protein
MNNLILEITYSVKGEIYHITRNLTLEKMDNYDIRHEAREYILKLDRHAILLKVRVNKIEFTYIIQP